MDGRRALVDEPFDENLMHRREDRITCDHVKLVVERHVGADELRGISHRCDVRIQRLFQPDDVFIRCDLRGLPCYPRFEQPPRLFHLVLARAGSGDAFDEAGQLTDEEAAGRRGYARARAAGDIDEAFLLQQEQGFAHGRTTHAEPLRQDLLGRKLAADLELAAGDGSLHELDDFVRAPAAANRLTGQDLHFTILDLWWECGAQYLVKGNVAAGNKNHGRGHRAVYGRCK